MLGTRRGGFCREDFVVIPPTGIARSEALPPNPDWMACSLPHTLDDGLFECILSLQGGTNLFTIMHPIYGNIAQDNLIKYNSIHARI